MSQDENVKFVMNEQTVLNFLHRYGQRHRISSFSCEMRANSQTGTRTYAFCL